MGAARGGAPPAQSRFCPSRPPTSATVKGSLHRPRTGVWRRGLELARPSGVSSQPSPTVPGRDANDLLQPCRAAWSPGRDANALNPSIAGEQRERAHLLQGLTTAVGKEAMPSGRPALSASSRSRHSTSRTSPRLTRLNLIRRLSLKTSSRSRTSPCPRDPLDGSERDRVR
jgi:hypothetical protein